MDIKVFYADWFYDGCHTEVDEAIAESKIKEFCEIAKTNDKVLYDRKREVFYILGDLKEFDLPEQRGESICTWLSSCNCSDEVDIADITFYKEDCIDILGEKLDNDEQLQEYIKSIFKQSYVENFDLGDMLINKMINHVVLEKISILQQVLIKEIPQIDWK